MSLYDRERDLERFDDDGDLSDEELAQRAYDALMFARQCKYYPSLDPFDHVSPRDPVEWERVNQEIDCRIYFGLKLAR